ncbi:MAG: proline--tRNA ligase, partial [Alphaproteobacteria bacterium]
MRLSQYFLPTLRETPAEARIASHRYMLRAGMINQTIAGIYSWLPLGLRVLEKIQTIICQEHDRRGFHKVLMPTVQPAELWRRSGRYDDYGKEMLRFTDRHERELLYGPTNEEAIADIFSQCVKSYRQMPQVLYQIQWKFRDEIRPRFGVMRGREFLMKDAYSFDMDYESACKTYATFYDCYLQIFARMGLTAIPVKADPGAIGGDMSQEFQIMAETGESMVYYDAAFDDLRPEQKNLANMRGLYAAADEMHKPQECPVPEGRLKSARGIEVGHIFYFGTKYSEPLGAKIIGPDGKTI